MPNRDRGLSVHELFILVCTGDPDPSGPGFIRTGTGMGLSLQVAGERRAYLLSDLGTFLAFRERTGLAALSGDDPALRNVYSVLLVNPERFDGRVLAEPARALERFLRSEPVQRRIAEFGRARFGEPLFRPIRDAGDA